MDFKDTVVLVVDDQALMRKIIRNILRRLGFSTVDTAQDGQEAFNKLQTGIYDLVIADWNMPKVSGIELLRMVRSDPRLKEILYCMVTAEKEEGHIMAAVEERVDGYITKPFATTVFEEKVTGILNRKKSSDPIEEELSRARSFMQDGRLDKAEEVLEEIRYRNPNQPKVLAVSAALAFHQGELDECERLCRKAIRINKQYLEPYHILTRAFEKRGEIDEGCRILQAADRLSPRNPKRKIELGRLYLKNGGKGEALDCFRSALDLSEKSQMPETRKMICDVYRKMGLEEELVSVFSGKKTSVNYSQYHNHQGIQLRKKSKIEKAILRYTKALVYNPNDEVLHYNLARSYREAGSIDEANSSVRKALDIRPDFPEAILLLKTLSEVQPRSP